MRRSQNKPTKFLRYITDPTGRQTLTLDYYAKGDAYDYINDTTWTKVTGVANLTNPHIIDQVQQITDISGRKLTFTYTDKGLLGELIDGAGSTNGAPKLFEFRLRHDPGQQERQAGPGHRPAGQPDRLLDLLLAGRRTTRSSTGGSRPSPTGSAARRSSPTPTRTGRRATTSTPPSPTRRTTPPLYQMDGFGRPFQTTNAKNETTKLGWDADHNVIRLEEANGAVSTWAYDPKTGYPTEIKDAEAVANGWPGTTLTYQTGLNGLLRRPDRQGEPRGSTVDVRATRPRATSRRSPTRWATPPPTAGDFTTTYTYDTWGQLLTAKDANGNVTANSDFHASGYPQTITDARHQHVDFVYDVRGNVTEVTNAKDAKVTQAYDTFGRPLAKTEPMDAAAGRFITTPAPVYDPNDNITTVDRAQRRA